MDVRVAPATADRAEQFLTVMGRAFGHDPYEAQIRRFQENFEWERSRVAFDGDRMIGTSGAWSLDITVPGSTMACGGTTMVSVLPTHRRRGVLRQMIASHLDDVRERLEPIAGLWASDSAIYGRFGYGAAAQGAKIEITRDHGRFHRLAPDPAPVRLLDADDAYEILPLVYGEIRQGIPGHFGRADSWWRNRRFRDEPDHREGGTAYRFAVTEDDGEVTGYVQYRFKEDWRDGHGQGEVRITELIGTDPGSWAGLWRFILDHDLTSRVVAEDRSVEDPLFDLLEGRRRAKVGVSDSLWIRIMDPKTALEGRAYSDVVSAVVEIRDPLDSSSSSWRLDLSPEGAQIDATTASADVSIDIEDLGACFMGWPRFQHLARTGRLTGDASLLSDLDSAFRWSSQPWCAEVF